MGSEMCIRDRSNEKRFVLLDGSQSADAIEDEIWEHLNKRYGIGN